MKVYLLTCAASKGHTMRLCDIDSSIDLADALFSFLIISCACCFWCDWYHCEWPSLPRSLSPVGWLAEGMSARTTWQPWVRSAGTPVGRKAISNEQLRDSLAVKTNHNKRIRTKCFHDHRNWTQAFFGGFCPNTVFFEFNIYIVTNFIYRKQDKLKEFHCLEQSNIPLSFITTTKFRLKRHSWTTDSSKELLYVSLHLWIPTQVSQRLLLERAFWSVRTCQWQRYTGSLLI